MATTSQIVDEVVFETRINDQSTAGVEAAEKALGKYDAAAKAAAAASRVLSGAASGAGEGIGAAATSFQQTASRVDDVTRAYNALKRAQDTLAMAQSAANREIAAGRADMDQVGRTLAELASRVETAAEKLGEARAEATANAEATAAWNGVLTQGAQAMGTFATGVAAQTQAMREEENAARTAAAAQSDLNRILNINVDGRGWKDAATYAQQVADGTDRLRASISPAFAALQTLNAELTKVANAEKIEAGTTEEWAAARVQANETYAKTISLLDGTAASAQAAASAFAAIDQLQQKWGSETAAVRQAVDAQTEINGLLRAGLISAGEAETAIEGVTESYRKMATAAASAALAAAGPTPEAVARLKPAPLGDLSPDDPSYQRRAADIAAYGSALDALRAKIDPLFRASKQYEAVLDEIDLRVKQGIISDTQGASARQQATAAFASANAPLKAAAENAENLGTSTRNANTQMRLMGVQAIQTFSGLATGQPVMMTLIQQGHQVADSLLATGTGFAGLKTMISSAFSALVSPLGLFVTAVVGGGAALTTFGVIAEHESTRLGNLRQQLRATHDDYGALATSADAAAKAVAASTSLSTGDARAAAQTIASAKYFSGTTDDIIELTKVSEGLARVWKIDLADASKFLRDAIDDPAKAAKEMADRGLPSMNGKLADSVRLMQAGADGGKAFATVFSALHQVTVGAIDDQSQLSRALKQLNETFTVAKEGGKSLSVSIGEMVDNFLALQVRGLAKLIEGLDRFIDKTKTAAATARDAYPSTGMNLETGAPNPGVSMPRVTSGGTVSTGSSISQVAESIRPLVEAAAKQYQVDTELLARLQLSENPSPNSDGSWPISSGNARGPMQVVPSTFTGITNQPYGTQFRGQDVNNVSTNVNAGAAYFAHLLDRYGDVRLAVLAYHDGETVMESVLNGRGNVSNSQPALTQALQVTRGYSGTGRPIAGVAASQIPAGAGGDYLSSPVGATGNLSIYGTTSAGVRDQNKSIIADAEAAARSLSLIEKTRAELIAQQKLFEAALTIPDQTPEQLKTWNDALNRVKGSLNDTLTPAEQFLRTMRDQLPAAQALTEGEQKLQEVQEALNQQERSQPGSVSPELRAQAIAAALDLQSAAFKRQVADVELSVQAQEKITAAYGSGYAAVAQATASTQAYNAAIKLFPPGSEQARSAAAALTEEFKRQAQAARDTQIAAATLGNRDQLEFLQAETTSLGANDNARTEMLNHLKAEQELKKQGVSVESELGQAYLHSVDALSAQTAAFKLQENSLNELKGFFGNTFDTIANSITQAFATGNLQALKFKDLMHSVASSVVSEFAKLAILNPLKNFLFGSNDVTLSSVGGVLGNVFGGGGAANDNVSAVGSSVSAIGSVGALLGLSGSGKSPFGQAGSEVSNTGDNVASSLTTSGSGNLVNTATAGLGLLTKLGSIKEVGQLLNGTYAGGSLGTIGDLLSTPLLSSAQGPTITGATLDSTALLGSGAGAGIGGAGVNVTAGSALGAVGGLYGAYTGFQRGGVGGNIQGAAGLASAGLAVAGSGLLGAGAAGLAAAAGPYAPIALAAIAVIGALLPGAHPIHPFQGTEVNTADGKLSVGKTLSQAEDPTAAISATTSWVGAVNDYMSATKLMLTNADGRIGAVGEGVKGFPMTLNPNDLFKNLRFGNDSSDTSTFGTAKSALGGMEFANIDELQAELVKIGTFAQGLDAVGIKLESVGRDLTDIHVASVSDLHPDQTGVATDASGAQVSFLNDLRTALQHDLPGQSFASTDALDTEINKVNQFVNGTLPGLLHPIEQTTSSIVEQANKVMETYQTAINQSLQYGLDNTKVLKAAEEQALAIVRRAGVEQIQTASTQLADRLKAAQGAGSQNTAMDAALHGFDQQAQQQSEALTKLWTDTYGDNIKSSQDYLTSINQLETTLGAERVKVAKGVLEQLAASGPNLFTLDRTLIGRRAAASGDQQTADLTQFDIKAEQEVKALSDQMLSFYGDAFASSQTYANQIAFLEDTLGMERVAIVKKYAAQQGEAITNALIDPIKLQGLVDQNDSIRARGLSAAGDQRGADLLNFDVKARQELTAFANAWKDVYGTAYSANADYQASLTQLEVVQGQERLEIVKKYGDAVNTELKSAQGNVASLFTSLNDYTTRLKNSDQSPLSPTAKYDLASSQFNAVAGAAAAGDAKSAGQLTGYSDALLTASRSVYGSGTQYVADFNRVLNAIQSVTMVPDQLTQSFMTLALQQQTTSIVTSIQSLQDEVAALRREMAGQSRLAALAA